MTEVQRRSWVSSITMPQSLAIAVQIPTFLTSDGPARLALSRFIEVSCFVLTNLVASGEPVFIIAWCEIGPVVAVAALPCVNGQAHLAR